MWYNEATKRKGIQTMRTTMNELDVDVMRDYFKTMKESYEKMPLEKDSETLRAHARGRAQAYDDALEMIEFTLKRGDR